MDNIPDIEERNVEFTTVDPQSLNDTVWCTIKPSKIHGVGIFAIRDIKKGQAMFCQGAGGLWLKTDLSKVEPEIRKLIVQRWPMEKDGYPFLSPNDDGIMTSFMNYSEDFNYSEMTDSALRDIKKGEEITKDYGNYKDIIKIK